MNKLITQRVTQEKAIVLSKSKFWEQMSDEEIFEFQVNTEFLCMPFNIFHKATEAALKRSVWTHEFASPDNLKKEFYGELPIPTMEDIINLLPRDKLLIVNNGVSDD